MTQATFENGDRQEDKSHTSGNCGIVFFFLTSKKEMKYPPYISSRVPVIVEPNLFLFPIKGTEQGPNKMHYHVGFHGD